MFVDSPTEWTTAVTDLILTMELLCAIVYVAQFRWIDKWKASLWIWLFGVTGIATLLGAIYHGLALHESTQNIIWQFVSLFVGLAVAFFVIATIHDVWSEYAPRWGQATVLSVALIFLGLNFWLDNQLIFLGYQAIAMLFALCSYIWCAGQNRLKGSWFIASAILVLILAVAIQATNAASFEFVWQFDDNGVSHLLQMIAIPLFLIGLRQGFDQANK